jgi:uncharacterized membrane protein YccC
VIVIEKPSSLDIVHAIAMAIACVVSNTAMTKLLNVAVEGHSDLVGGMWAALATVFVFRDSRQHSLPAGLDRLIATCVSFLLCLPYLWFFRANIAGRGVLLAAGTLGMVLLGRREDIISTAVTTIVVMVVASVSPEDAWRQPLLRLFDTAAGIVIGVAGKWIASFAFYKARDEPIR